MLSHGARFFAATLTAAMLTAAGAAWAQNDKASTAAALDCVCAEQTMQSRRDDAAAEHKRYDESLATARSLGHEAQAAHGRVNTDNRDEIEAYTALLSRRDAAIQAFDDESARNADAVKRYGDAVNRYNRLCTGRLFDPGEMTVLRQSAACPRP